jgi:hypothetical protein
MREILCPGICVDEDAGLLECYAVVTGKWLRTFRVVLCPNLHGPTVHEEINAVLHLMAL